MGLFIDALYSLTLLPHYAWHRLVTDKYGSDAPEKLGKIKLPLHEGPTLWIHAVSVGEVVATRSLVRDFHAHYPDWRIVISTTTATGREVAQKHFPEISVIYFPLDLRAIVRQVFDEVNPDLIILMELEVWPHFLAESVARDVPVVVSNVRITERSVRGFQRFGRLAADMLNQVHTWLAQNEDYAQRLRRIGVEWDRVSIVGSLKYDGLDLDERPEAAEKMKGELGGGQIFIAGSTHQGEDEVVYEAFDKLRTSFPELRLVLVPRHPERCDAVAALCPEKYKLVRRSAGPAPADSDVVLGDTMGELADMYRAADVVFIGGTLLPEVGGHNMLEPAAFARPVIYGPEVHNFTEPAAVLEESRGAVKLSGCTAVDLATAVGGLLADPARAYGMGLNARDAARSMQGATAKTLEIIKPLCS